MKKTKICVMGLGKIGLSVAVYATQFLPVIGYDIKTEAITKAIEKKIDASSCVKAADVYIVSVNTYYRNDAPDMSAIESCCSIISQTNPSALVCFESTLSVGTARRMAATYGLDFTAVCPHRWWEEDQVHHGVSQLRVLGALNKESLLKAKDFYSKIKVPIHIVSSLEIAEATKIAENAHRYIQIALAEELKLIAIKNRLSFDELRTALNTKWNVDLPEARTGIGRECLPKDIKFLEMLDHNAVLLQGAIKANENYVKSLAMIQIQV
jgi:UDP-N-acetyl-D-mannosaminuronic acid dehydrogenase